MLHEMFAAAPMHNSMVLQPGIYRDCSTIGLLYKAIESQSCCTIELLNYKAVELSRNCLWTKARKS